MRSWPITSGAPSLGAREVHVWRIPCQADEHAAEFWRTQVTDPELLRIGRFKFHRDGHRNLVCRGALRHLLEAYTGISAHALNFSVTSYGKPAMAMTADGPRLEFNCSHSADWVLIGLARQGMLGVDVEQWNDFATEEMAHRCFSAAEARQWLATAAAERSTKFFATWTKKEAYLKALGVGLHRSLQSFTVRTEGPARSPILEDELDARAGERWDVQELEMETGYSAAAVFSHETDRVQCYELANPSAVETAYAILT